MTTHTWVSHTHTLTHTHTHTHTLTHTHLYYELEYSKNFGDLILVLNYNINGETFGKDLNSAILVNFQEIAKFIRDPYLYITHNIMTCIHTAFLNTKFKYTYLMGSHHTPYLYTSKIA